MKLSFLILIIFVKQTFQNECTKGVFFQKLNKDNRDEENLGEKTMIDTEFFECSSKKSCTNTVELSESKKFKMVNSDAELAMKERPVAVWKVFSMFY